MKTSVIGAGAIGALVAGYLKLQRQDVSLIGRPDSVKAIKEKGLEISGVRGRHNLSIDIVPRLDFRPDLAILCTKTQDINSIFQENLAFLKTTLILTTQNGMHADSIVSQYVAPQNLISSIIMFGATYLEPGKITHNFEGSWILGRISGKNDVSLIEVAQFLNQIFPTILAEDLEGMKYLKIFLNANNCLAAILGESMQQAFADSEISQIAICILREGLQITSRLGRELISLPDFPVERLTKLTALPTQQAAETFSGMMINLSKAPLYGSILQSIKRSRPSEIDYINGEFVNLAKNNHLQAPLNERLVELVHQVEKTGSFLTKEELIAQTRDLLSGDNLC